MRKYVQALFIAVFFFAVAIKSNAQWNLNGNANATGTSILGTTNAVSLQLATRNLTRLVIDSNGKVGIGIAAPPNVFSVKGSGGIPSAVWVNSGNPLFTGFGEQVVGNADYILSMASSLANARPVFIGRRARGTLVAPTVVSNNDQVMSFLSSGYDGAAFQNAAAIDFFVDGIPTGGNIPTRISFVTGSNSGNRAERLKIGNTGDITINTNQLFVQKAMGNVGIGNILPQAKLDITGNIKITDGTQAAGKVLTSDNAGLASWQAIPVVPETDPKVGSLSINKIPAWNGTTLADGTITDNGNIGIGNATPTAKLDVAGNIKIADGTQAAGKVLTSNNAGLASWQAIPVVPETDPKVGSLSINKTPKWNGSVLADGAITDNGNVGIGESNPQGILHVSQPFNFAGVSFTGTGLNDLTANVGGYTGAGIASYVIRIQNPGPNPNIIEISNDGGATFGSPAAITNPVLLANGVTATFASAIGHNFGDQWSFSTGISFNNLLFADSGRVGINTKTPAATLDVAGGDARINGLTVGRGAGNDTSNTILGYKAFAGSSGKNNTAVGSKAMLTNTTGNNNAAIGTDALKINTTGNNNIAVGASASRSNTTGFANIAIGIGALSQSISGNNLVAIGDSALYNENSSFGKNTAIGSRALRNNTTGDNNTVIGFQSMYSNIDGFANTAIGAQSLRLNTYGNYNTATGHSSLNSNTTGSENTANGYESLFRNKTGIDNTANGNSSLLNNTSGDNNTANGSYSLYHDTSGNNNTANGSFSLYSNTIGNSNVAMGYYSLSKLTSGNRNVAIGDSAIIGDVSGNDNSALGYNAFLTSSSFNNATALGANTVITANSQVRFGNSAITSIGGQVGYTTLSDGRFKTNIKQDVPGISFINKLNPVTYHLDVAKLNEQSGYHPVSPDDLKARDEKTAITYTGFIAQDVEKAAKELSYDFSGVDAPKNDKDVYGLRYAEFVVPLVKAVQELSKDNEQLKMNNEQLKKDVDNLKIMMQQLMNNKSAPCPPLADK